MLFGTSLADGGDFAERVAQRLATEPAVGDVPFTVSARVASLGRDDDDPERLMLAADRALYAATEAGPQPQPT